MKHRKVEVNDGMGWKGGQSICMWRRQRVVTTYNWVSRFGWRYVMLAGLVVERRGVAASVYHNVCVEFHECGDDDEREWCDTDLWCPVSIKARIAEWRTSWADPESAPQSGWAVSGGEVIMARLNSCQASKK